MVSKPDRGLSYLFYAIAAFLLVLLFGIEERSSIDIVNGNIRRDQRVLGVLVSRQTKPTQYSAQVERLKLQGQPEWTNRHRHRQALAGYLTHPSYSSGFYFGMAVAKLQTLSEFIDADTQTSEILKLRQMARDGKGREAEYYVGTLWSKYPPED